MPFLGETKGSGVRRMVAFLFDYGYSVDFHMHFPHDSACSLNKSPVEGGVLPRYLEVSQTFSKTMRTWSDELSCASREASGAVDVID